MLRHFSTFLMGTLFGAALMAGLLHYYLVRDQEGFHLIRKVTPKLNRPYHDIRSYGAEDWQSHPDLGLSLARANRTGAIGESILKPWKDAATQVLPPAERLARFSTSPVQFARIGLGGKVMGKWGSCDLSPLRLLGRSAIIWVPWESPWSGLVPSISRVGHAVPVWVHCWHPAPGMGSLFLDGWIEFHSPKRQREDHEQRRFRAA